MQSFQILIFFFRNAFLSEKIQNHFKLNKKTKGRDEKEKKSIKLGYALSVRRILAVHSPHLRRTFAV